MRDSISANTKRAKESQTLQPLEGTPFLECAGGAGPGRIARDTTVGGGALTGLRADRSPAERPVDVLCVCGTVLSEDRLSLPHGPSGLVGRVLELGHAAGEPIVAGVNRPPGAAVGPSQGQTGTNLCHVFMGADNARRVANLAGRGDAATVGDVAAEECRGVARVVG